MRPYLLQVLRERRNAAGKSLRELEPLTGVDRSNLSRLETEKATHMLDHLDGIVRGYAEASEVHPSVIWREALDRWAEAETLGVEATRARTRRSVRQRRAT
jgi:transcriptional regulator with XRE-family HTH domain